MKLWILKTKIWLLVGSLIFSSILLIFLWFNYHAFVFQVHKAPEEERNIPESPNNNHHLSEEFIFESIKVEPLNYSLLIDPNGAIICEKNYFEYLFWKQFIKIAILFSVPELNFYYHNLPLEVIKVTFSSPEIISVNWYFTIVKN
jgi:hypothetical protein